MRKEWLELERHNDWQARRDFSRIFAAAIAVASILRILMDRL